MEDNMARYDTKALAVFNTVCRVLDSKGLNYNADKEKLMVFLSARGEDLPINLFFRVDDDRNILTVHSILDTEVSRAKRVEFALAINVANLSLINGTFDFDIESGMIAYRMAHPYLNGTVSEKVVDYLTRCTFSTVDEYNDSFLMLNKGMMDIEKFIELEKAKGEENV
jgi:hypothetical protein